MSNQWFTDPDKLKASQYASQKNLSARIYVHEKYSTNPIDYPIWIFDRMLEDFPADSNILEFGCGNALIWYRNAHRIPDGWTITLTDLSSGMLDDAKQNLGDSASRFNFQVVDIQDVPFDDKQFDVVIANFMLYHVPNRQQAIQQIRRVLKPSGILHTVTLGEKHMFEFIQLLQKSIPNYQWQPTSLPFRVENAEEMLRQQFDTIVTIPYPSDLRITDVDPIVEYMASTARVENVTHDQIATFRQLVTEIIRERGELFVQKQMVLFKAQGYTP